MIRTLLPFAFILTFCATTQAAEDQILKTQVGPVDVEMLIPKESRPVRGVLVHVFNYKLKPHDRWATLCREQQWVHINTVISRKANNRPQKIREAINASLEQFAKEANLPELVHVPRTGTGFSAGGMVVNVLEESPELMLTNAISCSWVRDPAKLGEAATIPELFIIGAVPDGFKMLPAIEKFYEPAIADRRPWALGLQHGCKHTWANSGTLAVAWIQGIVKLRYPTEFDPTQAVKLKDVSFDEGWLGDRTTINGQFATVTPAHEYKGDPKFATWFPDRATAFVWRAWQTKKSPADLSVKADDGTSLPPFNPQKSFGMSVVPNTELVLGVAPRSESKFQSVRYYHGDTLIGEATESPWEIKWTSERVGCYAVWAQYDDAAVTNPALICFEPTE